MSKPRTRVCLEDGLKLDLDSLARRGFIKFGDNIGLRGITWHHAYWGPIASGLIRADMRDSNDAWLSIESKGLVQRITLAAQARHFGGRQWFFVCPVRGRRARVLWRPPGASRFCSRQVWRRQVAYHTQFLSPTERIWAAKHKLNKRLCRLGGLDADDWDFPPKPKWMRWKTYERWQDKFEKHEDVLDGEILKAVSRLAKVWG